MEFNNEELIEQLNRLLEQLHQVGLDRRWNLHIHLEASPLPSPKGKGERKPLLLGGGLEEAHSRLRSLAV